MLKLKLFNKDSVFLSLTMSIALTFILSSLLQASSESVSGFFVLREGRTVEFTKIDTEDLYIRFEYGPQDKITKMPYSKLKKAVFGKTGYTAFIKLKDGQKLIAQAIGETSEHRWDPYNNLFKYYYFDDAKKAEKKACVDYQDIAKIVIEDNVDTLFKCPKCDSF